MNSPLAEPRLSINNYELNYELKHHSYSSVIENDLMNKEENNEIINNNKESILACIYFAMVGIGYLFPFSALTQPVDYWRLLFPNYNIEFSITSVYMYTNLFSLGLIVSFGGRPSFTKRIVGGFIGQWIALIFVPTSYFIIKNENINKIAILSATAFVAIVTAFLDSSVIALASQYPIRIQESFQFGIGLSTLIGSLYRVFSKLAFSSSHTVEASLLYFYVGAITIGICICAFYGLKSLSLSKKCFQNTKLNDKVLSMETTTEELSTVLEIDGKKIFKTIQISRLQILKKIWYNEIVVTLLFVSTLALWPPLVTEIKSYNYPNLENDHWFSLILLTIFSFFDCFGRLVVRFRGWITKDNILFPVILRFIILFPCIIFCVKGVWFFKNDFLSMFFVGLLGLTNGYLGTLSIILVNEAIEVEEQETAGTFTSFFLNIGLVIGASIGLLLERLVIE